MKITVTAEDIEKGIRQDCIACPIARALRRKYYDCRVTADLVEIGKTADQFHWSEYKPTRAMIIFINNFDNGLTVLPTEFTIKKIR